MPIAVFLLRSNCIWSNEILSTKRMANVVHVRTLFVNILFQNIIVCLFYLDKSILSMTELSLGNLAQ